jgi:DnaK suppressor protein
MSEERQRYSDADLVEFKELIQAKIVKAERDLMLVRERSK